MCLPGDVGYIVGDVGQGLAVPKGGVHNLVHAVNGGLVAVVSEQKLGRAVGVHVPLLALVLEVEHGGAASNIIPDGIIVAHSIPVFSFFFTNASAGWLGGSDVQLVAQDVQRFSVNEGGVHGGINRLHVYSVPVIAQADVGPADGADGAVFPVVRKINILCQAVDPVSKI